MLRKGHGGLYKVPTKEVSDRLRERGIRSSLLILDLKDGKLKESREEEDKMFHELQTTRIKIFLNAVMCKERLKWVLKATRKRKYVCRS